MLDNRLQTHSEYVIFTDFPRQGWLRERASLLRHTYITCLVRLGAHWQLKSCGDKKSCCEGARTATKKLLVLATFFYQYRMDFTETACVCALLLRIRKDRRKSDTGYIQ